MCSLLWPDGISGGSKDWVVECDSLLPADQVTVNYEDRLKLVEETLTTVKSDLADLKQDSLLWGTGFLMNVAAQALLFAYGDQPQDRHPGRRFQQLASRGDNSFLAFANALPLSPDPQRVAIAADSIIDRCNNTLHFQDIVGLEESVASAFQLLSRHPSLRTSCREEVMMLDNFDRLKAAFNF